MSDTDFYRIDLSGKKVWLPYLDLHQIRRDILLYFDENVGEAFNILMPQNIYKHDYWKYLSIGFDNEWAESVRYQTLIERGCLTLINGITLEILDGLAIGLDKTWSERRVSAEMILPYMGAYQPGSPDLNEGKQFLMRTLNFIIQFTSSDLDANGALANFDLGAQAKWFDQNIIQNYYRSMNKEC